MERRFAELFGAPPDAVATAPGRVNLIGEHIDYNGGVVMPMGLPVGLAVAVRRNGEPRIRVASDRFDGVEERAFGAAKADTWADYAVSTIECARAEGLLQGGADLYVESTLPDGAGLSSSAALIVAILKSLRAVSDAPLSDIDIALMAQRVENDYIGMPCGVMDQVAVAVAAPGQAILLDTDAVTYEIIEPPQDHHMAVVHSGVHRKLSDGRYAERKVECDRAVDALGVDALCLLSDADQEAATRLPAPLDRRVRHCVSEHRRTLAAATALKAGDIAQFGALMNDSHRSMRDDFEMSLPAIDALVESAIAHGAAGARLTGGGFGGCIVACVPEDALPEWRDKLLAEHPDARFVC